VWPPEDHAGLARVRAAFELFFGHLQASPYHDAVRARQGRLSVPPGPGLGLDPDMEILNRYRLGPPVVIES
jgi:L-alanine-DL-glutamate epimerase-like enolase superfamily enzyme